MRHALTATASATLLLLAGAAAAQTSGSTQTIVIEASADASAAGLSRPYAGGQVARGGRVGLLGTQDIMDTPFSVTSYTAAGIQDQQARSVGDVLQNDPAVRNARGFGNFQELYVIRGFPVFSDDIAYNGLYGLLPRQYVAVELVERVEVLRGASAFLNGAAPGGSGLGGAINLMPKRAARQPLSEVTAGWSSGGQAALGVDLSRRFGASGLRANAVVRNGDSAVDGESRKLDLLGVGYDWRGNGARISADIGYQNQRQKAPRPSVTPLGAIPDAPDSTVNWAQPWTFANERQTFGTLRSEFDLAPGAVAWVAAGMRSGSESNSLALTSAAADGTASAYRFDNTREDRVSTAEVGVRGSFTTGPVKHEIAATAATFGADFKNAYAFSNFAGFATDLNAPVAVAAPPADFFTGGVLAAPLTTQKIGTRSFGVADSMKLMGDQVLVTVGVRRQTLTDRSYDYNTGAKTSDYDESRTTPMLALLWKFGPTMSVYGNYIEGLVRGEVAPLTSGTKTVTNGGQALAPNKSKQTELGAKFDLGRLGGSIAVFSITKPVGVVEDIDATTAVFVSKNDQRHRGLELSVFGEAAPGLTVLGGASFIDAKMIASGQQAVGVPRRQLNLGTQWTVMTDLDVNARVTYTGPQWADAGNTNAAKAWTRLDVGVDWKTVIGGTAVTLRARVDNVFDKSYWASVGGYPGANYLVLGSPRTFGLSATASF